LESVSQIIIQYFRIIGLVYKETWGKYKVSILKRSKRQNSGTRRWMDPYIGKNRPNPFGLVTHLSVSSTINKAKVIHDFLNRFMFIVKFEKNKQTNSTFFIFYFHNFLSKTSAICWNPIFCKSPQLL